VQDHKLAYPVRYGARTVHLTESEVADRYRCRFAQARERAERLDEVIAGGQAVLDPDQAWLTVAVVPEVAGTVPIDHAALERLTRWVRSLPKFPLGGTWRYELGNPGVAFRRVRLGPATWELLVAEPQVVPAGATHLREPPALLGRSPDHDRHRGRTPFVRPRWRVRARRYSGPVAAMAATTSSTVRPEGRQLVPSGAVQGSRTGGSRSSDDG
jgi:hypothetical protein